ncbi:MAG TPA: AI-2E family transporter [Vicinamibacteria bacterium]|jgi:predicted PurR-regulated permease PerM|nr:AI-2E family transporter [Vicinamibacteria bacterium]
MRQTTERERVSQLLFYGALALLAYLFYQIVSPFLVQLGWAAVLAICFQPFHERLARRSRPGQAALVSTLLILVLLVVPATFVATALISEGSHAVTGLQEQLTSGRGPERIQALWEWGQKRLPLPPLDEVKATVVSKIGGVAGLLAAKAGGMVRDALVFVFNLVVTLLAFFFLLRDGALIHRIIRRLLPFEEAQKDRLIAQTRDLVAASVTASLVIGLLQGLLGGITLAALGVRSPVLWGAVMAAASLIPVVGASLVWLPTGLWLLASGDTIRGIVLLAVGAVIIGNVDNLVRPQLLAGKATMNGLVVFISLLGGVAAFGLIGLVLGPLVVATVSALLKGYTAATEEEPPTPPAVTAPPPSR